jgi:hypothetical protein
MFEARPARAASRLAETAAAGHDFRRLSVFSAEAAPRPDGPLGQALDGEATAQSGDQPQTDRKALFCHQCPEKVKPKVAVYSQWASDHRDSNITFAKVLLLNHNIELDIDHAGVVPAMYDEDKQQYGKVDTLADLCSILKGLQDQGVFPPKGGAVPAVFLPFGKQLRGDSGETLGWHIPDIKSKCQDFEKINATSIALIDSEPDSKCSKALLHEISHAAGNVDLTAAEAIMGPCDPSVNQNAPLGCKPDRNENTITAREVKKFCAAPF